jgi:uncharacterized protein (DUF1800 family)
VVSSWRATGYDPRPPAARPSGVAYSLARLGQRPFLAPSPEGWSDRAVDWLAPHDIVKRLAWAQDYAAARRGDVDAGVVAQEALGPLLSGGVADALRKAESQQEALAVLLMSPEFQRR